MVLFPPPYQIAEESLQSLQNKVCSRVVFFFIYASPPTKMVIKSRNPKDISETICIEETSIRK
jgi:hypothetical protein